MNATQTIHPANDYLIEQDIQRPSATTGNPQAATALTGLEGWISATDGGEEIHESLRVALAERSGTPGRYHGTVEGDALDEHLTPLVGSYVWVVVGDDGNVLTSTRKKVQSPRRPRR